MSGVSRSVGIDEYIDIGLVVFGERQHPQLFIECRAPMVTAFAPALQWFGGKPRQGQAPAGVDAVCSQRLAVEAVNRGQARHRQARIPLLYQAPGSVVLAASGLALSVITGRIAQVRDVADR